MCVGCLERGDGIGGSSPAMPNNAVLRAAMVVTGLVIPDAGPFVPEEAPEELSAAVLDFLR